MSTIKNHKNKINNSGLDISELIDSFPFYVLLIDSDHRIILANRAVQKNLHKKPEEIIGEYCPKAIHGLDTPFYACPLEEAVKQDKAIEREAFDPETGCWVRSAIYPIKEYTFDGKNIFFHMVTDITDRKHMEEQLFKSKNKLHSLSVHLESVRDEEKKKIARDIHDGTNQVITSLSAYLEAALRMLPEGNPKINNVLKSAQKLSTRIFDELQKLIYELRPSVLDDLGIIAATHELLENDLKAAGIQAKIEIKGKIRDLSHQQEIALYRIIQESISNIIRHSLANKVEIGMQFGRKILRIYIRDNGKGFNIRKATKSNSRLHGFGLLGMRERAELLNGTITFRSKPDGAGTEINIKIPIIWEVN